MTAVFTFSVILQARGMPHGLLNLPKVAAAVIDGSTSSTDSYLMPVKQLASSIFVSVPNAEQSAIYGVDPHVLIANANILPGTSQAMELERYWPYEWVPLSFAGMWYGTFGWFAQLLWFGSVGWLCGYASYNIQRSSFPILSIAPLGIGAIIGLLSIQYSSRMVWRIVSILLVMAVVGFLTRRSLRWHPPLLTAGRAP
jgi:iron complex transport system permease protein